jgi:hypothetical protein
MREFGIRFALDRFRQRLVVFWLSEELAGGLPENRRAIHP